LAVKELAVVSQQHTISHFLVAKEFLNKNNITVIPHPPYSLDLVPYNFFLFPQLKILQF
jgi:hypothetical protein